MSVKGGWPIPIEPARGQPARGAGTAGGFSPIDPMAPARDRRTPTPRASGAQVSVDRAVARGHEVLLDAVGRLPLTDPMLPAILGYAARHGEAAIPSPVLGAWRTRLRNAGPGERDTPWVLGRDAMPGSEVYESPDRVGGLWRPRERDWLDRDPTGYGHRLLAPIALAENVDFLVTMSESTNAAVAQTATELLTEIQPRMEADLAASVDGEDPWRDTFAVWLLTRRPGSLTQFHPLALAVATIYGTLAYRLAGLVCGTRYPFEAVPLVSANAHLGGALWQLSYRASLLPGIVAFVRSRQTADGGFADEGQPADILTTLAAADLLGSLDPGYDPTATAEWFARVQEPGGWWRALDPETPWLTAAVVEWLETARRPFAERFRWPSYQRIELDRKTGIPGYAAFDRIARLFETLPAIAAMPVSFAFCDLAGFREFNNTNGQDMGDRLLRSFAAALAELPAALAVRDGGDEFLVIGAPGRSDLAPDLEALLARWPERLRAEYGPAIQLVAPRMLVAMTEGADLRRAREALGRGISRLKEDVPNPPPTGVLRRYED